MSSNAKDKDLEVVSNGEAFLLFVIFAFLLYILYPKEMLEKQVLAESSNYDLTVVYLENMIRLDPKNKKLTLALIKSSAKSGNFSLSLKMIKVLRPKADDKLLMRLDKYAFEALKSKYFSTNEKKYHAETVAEILVLFNKILNEKSYAPQDLEYWYKGAREFSLYTPALEFLRRLLQKEERLAWLEECYYLSGKLKVHTAQDECLQKLEVLDKEWTQKAYYLAREEGKTKRAIVLLEEMSKSSVRWRKELASFYLELKQYTHSSAEYMKLHAGATSKLKRKTYLKQALKALEYGKEYDKAVILARKYEKSYYKDKKMSMYFIKLYLAMGKLEDASRVSIERLKSLK